MSGEGGAAVLGEAAVLDEAAVLVVCTGNVCRSPLIERLLRLRLGGDVPVVVSSAGTRALVGEPMTAEATDELVALGGDPGGSAGRRLAASHVADADLVVTATRAHRGEAVSLHPRGLRYTFTLRELARLLVDADLSALPDDPVERVRALPALAASRRGFAPPGEPTADDVDDPIGRSRDYYRRTTNQIVPAVQTIVTAVLGATTSDASSAAR